MSLSGTRILVGTDGSRDAMLAADAASRIAFASGSELHLVNVWQGEAHPTLYESKVFEDAGREILDEESERLGVNTHTHLRMGSPARKILGLAGELSPSLIVVGSRGLGGVGRALLGSVSEGIAHRSPYPVLVARGAWPPERVVAAYDGSDEALSAARMAAEIASIADAEFSLVRVYQRTLQRVAGVRSSGVRTLDAPPKHDDKSLGQRATELEAIVGRHIGIDMRFGDPAEEILGAARGRKETTLFAVGSRGLGTMYRLRLGSVSTKVLRGSKGPVLIHPHDVRA